MKLMRILPRKDTVTTSRLEHRKTMPWKSHNRAEEAVVDIQ
jgi:hypothetical protein